MAWKSIGCPIKTFSIQYKIKSSSASSSSSSASRSTPSLLTSSSLSVGGGGQHQPSIDSDWILLSSNVVPEQREISIVDLRPATWYSLLMIATSDPGPVQREYLFATLTDAGGKYSESYTNITVTNFCFALNDIQYLFFFEYHYLYWNMHVLMSFQSFVDNRVMFHHTFRCICSLVYFPSV